MLHVRLVTWCEQILLYFLSTNLCIARGTDFILTTFRMQTKLRV